jgi:hypothetical protein
LTNADGAFTPLQLLGSQAAAANPTPADPQMEAGQALFGGDFQQALTLSEKISDPQMRALYVSLARSGAVSAAISAGDYDEAWRRAQSLPSPSQRAQAFVELAQAVRGQKGAVRAAEILALARQSLETEADSGEKAQALLTLADAMIELETGSSFELAQIAIELFNSVHDRNKTAVSEQEAAEAALTPVLTRLARRDFARTWNLTLSINNRELAWLTKIALCQDVIEQRAGGAIAART